ncbi:MarR family winged helix-turn-helix transcriptional regulator [Companilactobacillus sp. DQM5]|uniref:MarR family winged helix-turn-helix transcriptional regulator n=1 Tax=Companilactobacillus sp. DQM5 TaxID=3463359 RepID=UPI004059A585
MEIGQKIFFLARQKGMFLKQIAKEHNYKVIELAILAVADHKPGVSQEEIRDVTSFDEASVARSLKSLEDRNLIKREVNPENKRLKKVLLTSEGQKANDKFKSILDFWDDELLSELTKNERDRLGELLDKATIDSEKFKVDSMVKKWRENNE